MNKVLLPVFVLLLLSCSKQDRSIPGSIGGTWKMIRVTNTQTGGSYSKPSAVQGDVIIRFEPQNATAGTFSGHTPSNQIMENEYTTGASHALTIPALSMTKVAETSWGLEFVDHICNARQYRLETSNRLSITTTYRILVFQKP